MKQISKEYAIHLMKGWLESYDGMKVNDHEVIFDCGLVTIRVFSWGVIAFEHANGDRMRCDNAVFSQMYRDFAKIA